MLDSNVERFSFAAASALPRGHYRIADVDHFSKRRPTCGRGHIEIGELAPRHIRSLVEDEHAELTLDDDMLRIGRCRASIVPIATSAHASIRGGGPRRLKTAIATANFQPLSAPALGIRLHNADLERLMEYVHLRLRCYQLIVLTVQ